MHVSLHSLRYKLFVTLLRKARLERGLTQEQVALMLAIPSSRVSRMETGQRRVDVIELSAFARLYKKPLQWFVPP